MPDIINVSKQKNYVCGRKIFLLDVLNYETCAELIGNISNMVDNLRWTEPYNIQIEQINNPYKLPKTPQIIDLYINSRGGTVNVMTSIMSLLTIARAKKYNHSHNRNGRCMQLRQYDRNPRNPRFQNYVCQRISVGSLWQQSL